MNDFEFIRTLEELCSYFSLDYNACLKISKQYFKHDSFIPFINPHTIISMSQRIGYNFYEKYNISQEIKMQICRFIPLVHYNNCSSPFRTVIAYSVYKILHANKLFPTTKTALLKKVCNYYNVSHNSLTRVDKNTIASVRNL